MKCTAHADELKKQLKDGGSLTPGSFQREDSIEVISLPLSQTDSFFVIIKKTKSKRPGTKANGKLLLNGVIF